MIDLFTKYLQMSQSDLFEELSEDLKNYYSDITIQRSKKYIYARGDIPILLVAHLDTVFIKPPKEIVTHQDADNLYLFSPYGLGADDRAGVLMIMHMLKTTDLRPSVLFTTNEETDMIGAMLFANDVYFNKLITGQNFVIELDRKGCGESVFYNCDNKDFETYINSFGFTTSKGTYTDISVICPAMECAGVNLSVGYYLEHSFNEIWSRKDFLYTYEKLLRILKTEKGIGHKKFMYIRKESENG